MDQGVAGFQQKYPHDLGAFESASSATEFEHEYYVTEVTQAA
jgi:hypothetical protein